MTYIVDRRVTQLALYNHVQSTLYTVQASTFFFYTWQLVKTVHKKPVEICVYFTVWNIITKKLLKYIKHHSFVRLVVQVCHNLFVYQQFLSIIRYFTIFLRKKIFLKVQTVALALFNQFMDCSAGFAALDLSTGLS